MELGLMIYVLSERGGHRAINSLDAIDQRLDFTDCIEVKGRADGIPTFIIGEKVAILKGDELDKEATATLMAEQAELTDYASTHEEPQLPWTPEQLETRFNWRG